MHPELSDNSLRQEIGEARAAMIVFGFLQVAFIRDLGDVLLVDVSAVGNLKHGEPRCTNGIVSRHPQRRGWAAENVRLDYAVEENVPEMRRGAMPDPEAAIRRLLRASDRAWLTRKRRTCQSGNAAFQRHPLIAFALGGPS